MLIVIRIERYKIYIRVYLREHIRFKIVEGTRVRLPVAKKRKDRYNDRARGSFASVRINCFASKLSFRFAGFDSPFHSQRKKQGITKLINTGRICENCFPSG